MDLYKLMSDRYSMRSFDSKQIEQDKLERVLNAGRVAPTAVNFQPQRIMVVQDKDSLEKMKLATRFTFDAPTVLIVGYDTNESYKSKNEIDYGIADVSIVITHMMLAATYEGLGTTFVAVYKEDVLREQFNLPEYFKPIALLPIGYPSEDCKPNEQLHNSRKDLNSTVYFENFDGLTPSEKKKH